MFCLFNQECNVAVHDILKGDAALMLEDVVLPGLGESGKRKTRHFDCITRPESFTGTTTGGGHRWPGRRQDGTSGAARSTRPLRGVLLPAPLLPGDDEGQPVRDPPGAS